MLLVACKTVHTVLDQPVIYEKNLLLIECKTFSVIQLVLVD